jgi:hypothetical protein
MPDQRILRQLLYGLERNVARGHVEVIDTGEDQLDRAPLGPDDKVDALRVTIEAVAHLSIDDPHEPDRAHAQREQQHVEERTQRARAQIAPGELEQIHAPCSTARRGNAN